MKHLALYCLLLQLVFEVSSSTLIRVVPGSSLVLPCLPVQRDYTGVTITWKHNGAQVPAESSGPVTINGDGLTLSISSITTDNNGEYMCVVKEDSIEWRKIYIVEVDASTGYTLKVQQGSTINLPCNRPSSNHDEAYALWFKQVAGGKRIQQSPVEVTKAGERLEWLYTDPSDSDQTITLKDSVIEDAGIYYCESATGERFNTINLIVDVAPTVVPHSCGGFTAAWEPCPDETSRSWAPILEESIAELSTKLYSHLSQLQPTKNMLYSPISISGVLTHLLLGARGPTRRDMEAALCVPHDFYCVHLQMRKLKEKLINSVQMASQIYYNPSMNLSESFANQSVQFYGLEPFRLRATSQENTEMINSWVAEHTNNKITQLVDSVPAQTQLILLNAVYFNGQWKVKFDGEARKASFTKLNGDLVEVPVLYSSKYSAPMEYISEIRAQVVRFLLTGESSLYILLPRTNKLSDLEIVEKRLTDAAVRHMIEHMKATSPEVIEVTLPKITLDIKTDMNILLRKLGLSSLFEDTNLCGLYDGELVLSDGRHRAVLTLTEDGVEAGAATSLAFSRSFSSFSVLRPFILLLWSDQANVPLFVGRVTEP
ncbi:plasma protease C1 inhibitor [Polymixia lowei]